MRLPKLIRPLRRCAAVLLALTAFGLSSGRAGADAFDIPADLKSYGVLSCQDLQMSGNSVITSEGVGGSAAGTGRAHVRSNGNVTVSGTAEIHGDVVAGPGKRVITSGNPLITGQRSVAASPYNCTPVDLAALRATLEQSNDNARVPRTDRGNPGLGGTGGRAITLSGHDGLTLPAGTYLISSISLSGNSQLRVSGQVRILVTGSVSVTGGSHINLNGNPFQMRLWSQGSVAISSQSNVHAYIYAPAAAVSLTGQMNIVGALQTQSLSISGGARIRRTLDDALPVITLTAPVEGQSVNGCQVTVSGRATDAEGPIAAVTVNGMAVTPAADGSFSTLASLATADPGLVEVVATDGGGNTVRATVRVAIVPPTVALTSPAPGTLIGTRLVDLAGTSGNATTVTVNGQAAVVPGNGDGTFRLSGFDLGPDEGLVTLSLRARSCGGEATATAVLDLDTKAPVVAIDSPEAGDLFGNSPITVSGPVTDAHLTEVKVNGVVAQIANQRFTAEGVTLTEGQNTLTAIARDALGRSTTSAAVTVELDSTAPTAAITEPENGAVVDTPQITVRGTVSDVNLVSVKVNGIPATVTGTDFVASGVPLVEGTNFLDAVARDRANHETEAPRVVVVLDTQPPVVAIDAAALPSLTGEATVTVTGTVADPHLASVTVNGVAAQVVGGDFVATAVPLQEGPNPLVAHAVDSLGHSAGSAPATVTRDSLPPEVAITEPLPGAQLRSRTVTVRGTVSEPHLDRVLVGSVQAVVQGGTWEAAGVALPEGDSGLVAHAEDTLDHAANSVPVPVQVDTLAPAVRLDTPADPLVGASPVTVTGRVDDPHLEEVRIGDRVAVVAPDGTFSVTDVPLTEGSNELRATASDTFEHEAVSEPVVYVLDSTAPEIAITSPADGETLTSLQVVIGGTVSDTHLLGVKVNGVDATLDAAAGTFQVSLTLVDGPNVITAVATDQAGHSTEKAITARVVLDAQPPAITFDQPNGTCFAAGSSVQLGGAFLDANPQAMGVEVVDAAGARRSYVGSISNSRWSVAAAGVGTADGNTTVLLTASDAFGNAARLSRSFRVDAATPVVRLILDGALFPGAAPESAPPGGAVPVLFGRQIAAGVTVEDGAAAPPPPAVLTLDGAPYVAGAPITGEGTHLLVATATDCAGHSAATHALFSLDLTAPALRSTSPAAGERVTAGVATFSGVSDSDLARATVNGRPAAISAGSFTLAPFPWREGKNDVAIELEDRAGHRATYPVTFTVRTAPLSVQILEGGAAIPAGATFLRPVRPEVRTSDSTATVAATLNGAPFTSGTEIAQSGSYHLVATASDDWGRTARAEVGFMLDLGAGPQIAVTAPADGAVVPGPTVRVEGTVSGDAPTVTVNGVAAAVTGGTWVVAALPLEPDVSNTLVATARDRRGRTATSGVTVRVVSGGPQVLILEPADGTTTNRSAIDVAGVVIGGRGRSADGTVTVQGRPIDLAADGTFRALDVPLQTGANTLTASVRDREGRTGSAAVAVTADFTPPAIRFFARAGSQEEPLADGSSFGSPITLVVEVADDAAGGPAPRIRLNGALRPEAAAPRTEIPLTQSGGYVVAAAVADAAGNETRAERSFVLDFGGCTLAEVTPAAGSAVATPTVTLVGRSGGAAAVKVRVPQAGGGAQEYTASLADGTFLAGDVPLPVVGENALELVCVDGVGAVQSTPHPIERLAAGAGPEIHITSPTAGAGALLGVDTVAVEGTVSSGAVTVNGLAAAVTPNAPGSGLDTFRAANVPLAEGPNPLLARALDAAGRTAEDRVVVHRDTQAPRVQITRPDNHGQVGVAGAGPASIDVSGLIDLDTEPNLDRVTVSSAQGSVTAAVDPLTGAFRAQGVPLDPAAGAGTFQTLTATATDSLGHTGTSTVDVALDPAGPAIVLTEPADLTRFAAGAPGPIVVRGEAWAAPGTAVSLNGVDLDPATLPWEAAGADGRRHVAFSASVNLPTAEGPFGIIARATDLQGRRAQDRRLLFRDVQAPRVIEMVPADGATGVDGNGLLLVLFSEPIHHASLDAADGLTLTRVSTGQRVVGTKTVAGQAVGFAPGAALAAGEAYVLRAGPAITDVAGNALVAPAEARFTVATPGVGGAPVLDALPAVVCADEIQVTGRAAPGATLKARDGGLVFTGFADSAGVFTVSVPVTGSGYHLLAVWALDPVSGARSPEAAVTVRIDCRAPSVIEARFDRATGIVRVVFSEDMDATTLTVGGAATAIHLLDAEVPGTYQSGTLTLSGGSTAEIHLDTATGAWWRDRPVRLQAGPPAADAEGNAMAAVFETVFFPGGGDPAGGFLFGEVYDDTTGRPRAGATVGLFAAGQTIPGAGPAGAPVAGAVTDGRGRFVLAGTVPAGRYALVVMGEIAGEETTRVYRRLSLRPATGVVPFDSRVTPLAEPAGNLDPVGGGTVTSGGMGFAADPAALPGSAPVAVRLTARSGQGLPDFLPLGWTPVAAAEVRLEQDGAALPEQSLWPSGAAHLDLPLPAWAAGAGTDLYAVRYEPGTGRWLALPDPEPVAGGVRISIAGPGTVAVVIADGVSSTRPPLPSAAGEPLTGVDRPAVVPGLAADLVLDPPVVGPTGRSRARVVARSTDGVTPWPSGLAVQAYLEERLVLTGGGGEVLEAPFSADLVLYHPDLTAAEQGSAAAGAAGAMEFTVSPSPRAAQVLLEVGWENIRLFPFPEEVERGPVVGSEGGTVDTPEGVELSIPEGALGAKVPVAATLLTTAELAELPRIAGYDTLAAVRIEISGATLARPATLSLPAPAGTPADSAASPRVILAELVEAPADGRGSLARLAARTRRDGNGDAQRVVAAPEPAGPLPLDGIVREGLYLLLAAHDPLGFATGFVRSGNGVPVPASRVTADGLGTGDLSRLTGRYAVPVSAGTGRRLVARHPTLDEQGTGTIPNLAPGQVVSLDLVVEAVPPRVVSKTPENGATNQPLATAVSILFSEALDPRTVTSSTLKLELAGADGESTGIFVDGAVTLADGVRVVFAPSRPLLPGRTFRAHFVGGVADAGGAIYAGQPLLWKFSTSTAIVQGGQVHPEKFHIRVPVNGVAEIYGEPGAMPGSLSGQTPWAVTPEIEGPVADPRRDTFQGKADGSFTGTVGHPPDFAVTIASKVWVKVFDPAGALAAEFQVGPFTTPDGLGFVAPAGQAVTFRSAEGLVVDVPARAFAKATLVTIRTLDPATLGVPTPEGLALGGYIDLDFEGEAKDTLRVHVPAPVAAADNALVLIGAPYQSTHGRTLRFLSMGGVLVRDGHRYLSNDPSLQPEPDPAALAGQLAPGGAVLASSSKVVASRRLCQQVLQDEHGNPRTGLPRCFLQSLLMEFTLRSGAAFFYEAGAQWAVLMGSAGFFGMSMGMEMEAVYNRILNVWTYVPVPHDWNGGFVLPVLSNEPFELVRRDVATGWEQARKAYDPVQSNGDLIDVGFLGSGEPSRPLLVDARPFQVYRLAAPEEDAATRLSLEIEVKSDVARRVTVAGVDGYPLARGTSVALYDFAPATPVDPGDEPAPPITGPATTVCGDGSWSTGELPGSDELVVVVGPGDLDAVAVDALELQFDQPLHDVTRRPPAEVAQLLDLGPTDEGCGPQNVPGYPRSISIVLDLAERGSRLLVIPTSTLPAGHRFRLDVIPSAIRAAGPDGAAMTYWETAPTRFEFGTRAVPGEPISRMPAGEPALGTTNVARDMIKLGNLLLVASETGDLVAFDVSRSSAVDGVRRHALENKGIRLATRSLATDGHNRVFYSGLFGSLWAVKTIRLEDVREATAPCGASPAWAAGLPCFTGLEGTARIAYALGSTSGTTASEWLALGTLPEATPMDLAVLAQDEKGRTLELGEFVDKYAAGVSGIGALTPDAEGIYTFDVSLTSTLQRSREGKLEPSMPAGSGIVPPTPSWRKKVCQGEEDYDRYQRVTIDNLTTGQTWSVDIENPWPAETGGGGDGRTVVQGVQARRGDQLRVRYNLRTLGHVALMGSGITVVDLNRFYRLTQPYQTAGSGQCGRRLGKFEGQILETPTCAPPGAENDGIRLTPSVVTHSTTGCVDGPCRGEGFIDIYSPLQRIGALHSRSTATAPGGVVNPVFPGEDPEGLQVADLAACIQEVGGQHVLLRDVALANDALWFYRGIQGDISGEFHGPSEPVTPQPVKSDLMLLSLGDPGIYVFDVSLRSVLVSPFGSSLIGRLSVPGHSAYRLQVDDAHGLVFAGGTDLFTGKPIIDVWDLRAVNAAPGIEGEARPLATLKAPWSTNQLGIDATGTGLVYTWGGAEGPLVVPFDRAQFVFSGLYRPEGVTAPRGIAGVQRNTSRLVPLGVPLETTIADERSRQITGQEKSTGAFKLRIALPGSLGPELTAKVQSLRARPSDRLLGREDVGAMVTPPGGPGWPENEVVVRLRRVGIDAGDNVGRPLNGEDGPLGTAYQLYESVETVLLLADPRAGRDYRRQDAAGATEADEDAQCRRCEWPGYLPDPEGNDPALDNVKELLAGHYVRAFLFPSDSAGAATRHTTEAAIAFFVARGESYPLPAGVAEIAGPADAVPSPVQVSLAEPAQSPAVWGAGEAGVSVALPGGELLVAATDHTVGGRAIPFSLVRTYRSGMLGYGPLGSAGWSASLFAHLRELPVTGEVEYHDGMGHVWRFFPSTLAELTNDDGTITRLVPNVPEGYEEDDAGSYYVAPGVYLRLQKLSGGQGWRLIGREHDLAFFDARGQLVQLGDRHFRGSPGATGDGGNEQGSSLRLARDPFGQLTGVVDDLGRHYELEYYDDPRPSPAGDGPRYGLLKKVTDFHHREVEYEYDEQRRLTKVKLPEVSNRTEAYGEFSYTGGKRPVVEYRYDPEQGVDRSNTARGAVLHGDFAQLRLASLQLPAFLEGGSAVPRARFEYEQATGRLESVGFPTPENQNSSTASVEWSFTYVQSGVTVFPPDKVTVQAPWGHALEQTLAKGRVKSRREQLLVDGAGGPVDEPVTTAYDYTDDGRLLVTTQPDGSLLSKCYPDGKGGPGCAAAPAGWWTPQEKVDRLTRSNVVVSITAATTPAAKGTADYDSIESGASFDEDNEVTSVRDGLHRDIDLALPRANGTEHMRFAAESVSARFDYDAFGRIKSMGGGGAAGALSELEFGEDKRGRPGAGLLRRVKRGGAAASFWEKLDYDEAFNVEQVETSQGTVTRTLHDEWDRVVRTVTGISESGHFASVGTGECDQGEGARVERAFDAAGHVVRERRLQDYVDPLDGGIKCRWVESSFTYNAREQLVSVEQTHLASATTPGQVTQAAQTVQSIEYDEHGRLSVERARAVSRPDLLTVYRYDPAGRVAGVRTGEEGEQRVGYDALSREVFRSDGDVGFWRGRYDAWGRLYHEEQATGAVVRRRFDRASNPIEETVFDADPTANPQAKVLSDVRSHVTSFGAMDRSVETLVAAAGETPAEERVTEQVFDGSGRVIEVWSGPPSAPGSDRVDRTRGRRESLFEYEAETGRVHSERYGGDAIEGPQHAVTYGYSPESAAPWPDQVTMHEAVPGSAGLVATLTSTYRRDALGRPLEERRSDGSLLQTVYDRGGEAIRVRTGAGAEASTSFDGRGLPVKVVRPSGRGFSVYAYDLDGALLREATRTSAAQLWETVYAYDATGRASTITYADGKVETRLYNADSTLSARIGRDGVKVVFSYDPANRLVAAMPTLAAGTASPTLLDEGDAFAYDKLSRPTELRRGRPGAAGFDPALAVRYPSYDLASRPGGEVVGARAALSWRYDTWDRPTEVTLPAGAGRNGAGAFRGFTRRYDTLDRQTEVSGLGVGGLSPTPMGATWAWGGADRLYGVTTRGALKTAARYGFHAGAGPQVPDYVPAASAHWKLGTLLWGAAGGAGATAAPQTAWGGFGFGWRGNEGNLSDGAKLGRSVLAVPPQQPNVFAGLGWAWSYDAGVRLKHATAGAGDIDGRGPPAGEGDESYDFGYGQGDELERIVREATGRVAELETGEYGRIVSRNGRAFAYDGVGRRLEDDRFVYRWSWRGELVSVTVKASWPDEDGDGNGEVTPWAGHQLRYDYDATGRLTHRWLYGKLPTPASDDSQRPFIEKRVFVWEGDGLAAEAAFGNAEETVLRWRKTYVPGPSGLDDAVQVVVEIGDQPSPYANSTHTYTLLRDELGTVIGLVAEDEGSDPAKPPVPVRYRYTPYGEGHAESGPELLRARFAADATTVDISGTEVTQHVADDAAAAAGAMVLDWSLPLAAGTLPAGLHVERLVTGSGWVQVDAGELAIGPQPSSAGTIGSGGTLPRLLVMARSGWARGSSYRVRLSSGLADEVGRAFAGTKSLEWRIPEASTNGPAPAVVFDERQAADFESWRAARDAVGGRFPGGQTALFQGLWTDPVTGMAYARARWYDARNASWMQEDPVGEKDSTNLYAFVGWQPNMGIDPMGLSALSSATDAAHSMCEAVGGDCSGFDAEQAWNVTKAAGEGLWQGGKDTAVGTVQGLWTLAKVTVTEGPGAAAKMMADATLDGIVNAPENLLNWLEYMNNATPEQAAKEFGRLAGGAAVNAVGPAVVGKVLGVGGKLARSGLGALGRKAAEALAEVADDVPQRALRKAAEALEELPCSFAAGTPVVTPEGLVPIEDVETGDFVRAYDEETGYESLGEVLGLSRREVKELWLLSFGEEAIEASEEHPFYVVGKGWVQTRELQVGDEFVAAGGERVRLEKVERILQPGIVYNFEVDELHDYFVGDAGVLGHNCVLVYTTKDALGRTTSASAHITPLDLGTGTRATSAARRAAQSTLGIAGDDAGHLIGRVLGGPGGIRSKNIVGLSARLNRGKLATFEKSIANHLRAGRNVDVKIQLLYGSHPQRVRQLVYEVAVNGKPWAVRTFVNY